jgi:hypothetical protein
MFSFPIYIHKLFFFYRLKYNAICAESSHEYSWHVYGNKIYDFLKHISTFFFKVLQMCILYSVKKLVYDKFETSKKKWMALRDNWA